jgi:hypothetical protein
MEKAAVNAKVPRLRESVLRGFLAGQQAAEALAVVPENVQKCLIELNVQRTQHCMVVFGTAQPARLAVAR